MDVDEEMTAEGKIISFEALGKTIIKLDPLIQHFSIGTLRVKKRSQI